MKSAHNLLRLITVLVLLIVLGVQFISGAPLSQERSTAAAAPLSQGSTISVTSLADHGPGTLRQALLDAHSGDIITFAPVIFPPGAPVTITLTTGLPVISQGNLTIDASNAGVILDGGSIPVGTDISGLVINSNGNTIRGLQIVNFPGQGIGFGSGSQYNTIGGDRNIGAGPLGQGNLISRNGNVGIGFGNASYNTIKGNYIGTDPHGILAWGNRYEGIYIDSSSYNQIIDNLISGDNGAGGVTLHGVGARHNILSENSIGTDVTKGSPLGNRNSGISIRQGASDNIVGPGNVVAYNNSSGIVVYSADSLRNTITQNRVHDNGWLGIDQWGGGNIELAPPIISAFNVSVGSIAGLAYPNATVEVFSTSSDEGDIFEGQTIADSAGLFAFNKSGSFSGPHLTATATDASGTTSEFSLPTVGTSGSLIIQSDNTLPKTRLTTMQSRDLKDNRIGSWWHSLWGYYPLSELLDEARYTGVKRFRFAINGGEWVNVDWSKPELSIDPSHDEFITSLANNNIQMTYNLSFWDMATWPGGVGTPCPRFKTEEEIQHYLEYVRFSVDHFKDRIQYYEIWNEPDNSTCSQWIEVEDYINLVRRTAPVIRQEYPEAKIQVGGTTGLSNPDSQAYLFSIIESDIMPLVDVVSWHPFYGDSPEYNSGYYYAYPSIVQNIKDVASAHGFVGEYEADEMNWRPHSDPDSDHPSYSEMVCPKYQARGMLMNLGLNVTAGNLRIPHQYAAPSFVVRNLSPLMVGAEPSNLSFTIQSTASNVVSYTFSLPYNDYLIALWTDGTAADYDPGVETTVILNGFLDHKVAGVDVLHGFEQQLITDTEGGNPIIRDLLVKDYPIILRLTSTKYIFMPIVLKGYAP